MLNMTSEVWEQFYVHVIVFAVFVYLHLLHNISEGNIVLFTPFIWQLYSFFLYKFLAQEDWCYCYRVIIK